MKCLFSMKVERIQSWKSLKLWLTRFLENTITNVSVPGLTDKIPQKIIKQLEYRDAFKGIRWRRVPLILDMDLIMMELWL